MIWSALPLMTADLATRDIESSERFLLRVVTYSGGVVRAGHYRQVAETATTLPGPFSQPSPCHVAERRRHRRPDVLASRGVSDTRGAGGAGRPSRCRGAGELRLSPGARGGIGESRGHGRACRARVARRDRDAA